MRISDWSSDVCSSDLALIRFRRMQGRNTLWQPGTDHAGIATQMLVERRLEALGQNRHDLGREKFLEKVWEWKDERSEEHTSELQSLMRISYAVFCLKKKKKRKQNKTLEIEKHERTYIHTNRATSGTRIGQHN